jgi:hypothetical protein
VFIVTDTIRILQRFETRPFWAGDLAGPDLGRTTSSRQCRSMDFHEGVLNGRGKGASESR